MGSLLTRDGILYAIRLVIALDDTNLLVRQVTGLGTPDFNKLLSAVGL